MYHSLGYRVARNLLTSLAQSFERLSGNPSQCMATIQRRPWMSMGRSGVKMGANTNALADLQG